MEEVGPDRVRNAQAAQAVPIQEVIKRRQILLVQVVKEERGNKGAALTTYLSLAGRYSVLMPNTARGGGISRKITNAQDRKRLKEVIARDLEVPQGMGVILRTAGANRTKAEVKRDFEYLMRLWENVRTLTLPPRPLPRLRGRLADQALHPRPLQQGHRRDPRRRRGRLPRSQGLHAHAHAEPRQGRAALSRRPSDLLAQWHRGPARPMFSTAGHAEVRRLHHHQPDRSAGLDRRQLRRLDREHNDRGHGAPDQSGSRRGGRPAARLRDLAGLIVIDFIDMEENRNNRAVEKKLKDCLKNDRARIQVGRISHFGLLEMSRQRIRASVLESTMKPCSHCGGTYGHRGIPARSATTSSVYA
jgi:ribonuclease E